MDSASAFVRAADTALLSTLGAMTTTTSNDVPDSVGLLVFASSTAFHVPLRKASLKVHSTTLYACVCMYVCASVYVYVYVCVCVCMCVYAHVLVYVSVLSCLYSLFACVFLVYN